MKVTKYSASSSIIILDYDLNIKKFKVIRRVEVPRGDYSYDNAVNLIIKLNDLYKPSWIYADAGSGEYQIERLHIYGDENPASGLKNKVKRWQFKQSIDIIDPVTMEINKQPMKPFMVNQLQISFEREKMMLSPFDEVLHKQLIDYEVIRIGSNGNPVFTSVNEHFVDALGLAHLAFVLEFPEIADTVKKPVQKASIATSSTHVGAPRLNELFNSIGTSAVSSGFNNVINSDPSERKGDKQQYVKVPMNYKSRASGGAWGSRSSGMKNSGNFGRSIW